jgi:superfamily II DNA helicase RecQ
MAKEFKTFDKEYAYLAGTALKTILGLTAPSKGELQERIEKCTFWPYLNRFTEAYSREEIHYAVYTHAHAKDWQKFRVSLKGLNTKEKLYCLGWYWDENVSPWLINMPPFVKLHIIRVNNYLGALKRAGCLDQQLHVIKL